MTQASIKKVSGESPVGPKESAGKRVKSYIGSTVGAKVLVAVTGLLLAGFLIAHVAGNLLLFGGQDAMNAYAATLKGNPALLWGARAGLIVVFLLHVGLALRLALLNRRARPIPYAYEDTVQASWASRHMVLTGLLIFAFLVYHLLHFTVGFTNPGDFALKDPAGRHDVYAMVVTGFNRPAISAAYLVSMVLLALHLSHGVGSMFRSVGVSSSRWIEGTRKGAKVFAVLLALAFSSIPIAVLAGFISLPAGGAQ